MRRFALVAQVLCLILAFGCADAPEPLSPNAVADPIERAAPPDGAQSEGPCPLWWAFVAITADDCRYPPSSERDVYAGLVNQMYNHGSFFGSFGAEKCGDYYLGAMYVLSQNFAWGTNLKQGGQNVWGLTSGGTVVSIRDNQGDYSKAHTAWHEAVHAQHQVGDEFEDLIESWRAYCLAGNWQDVPPPPLP